MAIWGTGVTWAPSQQMLDEDYIGASEHVASHFAAWVRRLAQALARQKNSGDYQEARRRSGPSYGKNDLIAEQDRFRSERDEAPFVPKRWDESWPVEQWWLEELQSGRLEEKKRKADAMCTKTQAKDFTVDDA